MPYSTHTLTLEEVLGLWTPRAVSAHKGTEGRVEVWAGNHGMMGAAILCARACMRAGSGLLTCRIPDEEFAIMQNAAPEAMCATRDTIDVRTNTIVFGPGVGRAPQVKMDLLRVIGFCCNNSNISESPTETSPNIVIDADGLFYLRKCLDEGTTLPSNCILTPHVGEFMRLNGDSALSEGNIGKDAEIGVENGARDASRHERLVEAAHTFAVRHNCVVVLKSWQTAICPPSDVVYMAAFGCEALATPGSGDVLAGIIGGVFHKMRNSKNLNIGGNCMSAATAAAIFGCAWHGMAATSQRRETIGWAESFLASDIIAGMPNAFGRFYKTTP